LHAQRERGRKIAVSTLPGNLIVVIRELFGRPVIGNSANGTYRESLLMVNCSK
jgi:hypothetical protein